MVLTNCSNNYGPYHFPEKLIPVVITRAVEEREVPIYGDGLQVRDWLHVGDHCRALLDVFERGAAGETYCVGGEAESTNLSLVSVTPLPGATADFVVGLADGLANGRGYVRVTDACGLRSHAGPLDIQWRPACEPLGDRDFEPRVVLVAGTGGGLIREA